MKIGIIYGYHKYPPKSGGDVHFYQLIKNLVEIGCDVKVFPWNYHPDVEVISYSKKNLLKFLYSINVLYLRWTWQYLDKYVFLKSLRPNLPVILEINAPFEEYLRFTGQKGYISENWLKILRKMIDGVIVVSNGLKDYITNELKIKNVCVIPNGSDPTMFVSAIKENLFGNDVNVFWMGSSKYPWQGLNYIADLLENKRKFIDDFKIRFTIVADRKYLSDIFINNPYVKIIDEVGYINVPNILKQADICLCLYDILYYEKNLRYGFYNSPLKLFDYMAAAKPIIASNIGQIAEVITDREDGLLVNGNIDSIVNEIKYLIENSEIAREMGQKARQKIISEYNWRNVALKTVDFINRI